MKIKFLPLFLLFGLFGCDDTTVDQVAKSCTDAGVDGNNQNYCACVSTAVEPSAELLAFYSGLSDLRGNVVSVGDPVSKGPVEVTIQSTSTSKESICKSEGDSAVSTLGSMIANVTCVKMGDDGQVFTSNDPSVCGAKTAEETLGKVEASYEYGCSYLSAPDSSQFLTMTLQLKNSADTQEGLLKRVGEATGVYAVTPDQAREMVRNASKPISPYESVDPMKQLRESMLSTVRDKGTFSFGKLVRINPEIGASTRKEVTNVVNHDRFDFLKENQNLSSGEQILSKIAFLTELDETLETFWSPGDGDALVNLDGVVVSEKLLSTLYPDQYLELSSAVDNDVRLAMENSCEPTVVEDSGLNALELL